DPNEHIISIGDYNAFQFNDGYVDSIGTIKGTPTPCDQVVLCSSDLVNPDLTDLLDMAPAAERYSFSFDGNAQVLDHELITQNLLARFDSIQYARNDADFPESFRNDPNRPERISDHDMPVAYFSFPPAETPTPTPTNTPTNTPTDTPTDTPTNTPTNTPTPTPTNTPTDTPTNTPTNTPSNTPTNTPTNTPSNTPTRTPTWTPTPPSLTAL